MIPRTDFLEQKIGDRFQGDSFLDPGVNVITDTKCARKLSLLDRFSIRLT